MNSTHKPAPKLKSVGVQPLGFGKGWSPSQGRNSASKSQKFADIKRNKANSHNTERTKAANKKSRMQKRKADHHSLHSKSKKCRPTILHAALTENADRREAMHRSTADKAAEGHLAVGIRRTRAFNLICGALLGLYSADIGKFDGF